ncbi:TIGR03086 family metal-binding protein [Nocardia sp. NPDC051756]|uniref:TIGR03086 family metal-binding protein n=1 Tax=Nocardia sp. NPDC051756 TaxID=3154751 RepID=UPI00343947AC
MIDLKPACDTMIDLLLGTSADQLDRPTPCSEYTVALLIDHIGGVAQRFTAFARKDTGDIPREIAAHPKVVAERVRTLGLAWDDPSAWQGTTALSADLEQSNELWGRIALTEMVVHAWDLAQATDRPFTLSTPTLHACLDHVVAFIPNAPIPELWSSAVETSDDAALIDRIVAVTGRNPRWAEVADRG